MTRKDYELIASALRSARKGDAHRQQDAGVDRAVEKIAAALANQNPSFKPGRFKAACES